MSFKRIYKPYIILSLPFDIISVFAMLIIIKNFSFGGEFYLIFNSTLRNILWVVSSILLVNRVLNFLLKIKLFNPLMKMTPDALPIDDNLDAEILDNFADDVPKKNFKDLITSLNLYLSLPASIFIAYFGYTLIFKLYGASSLLEITVFISLLIYGICEMFFYRLIKGIQI